MRRVFLASVCVAVMAAGGLARAEDEWKPRKILGTGDVMPDGGAADYITGWPVINDRGDVAYVVNTKKEKPRLEFGTLLVVRDAAGKLRVPLQKGTSLGGGDTVDGMASIVLSDDGFVAAKVSTSAPRPTGGSGLAAIFAGSDAVVRGNPDGKLNVIAKTGGAAAGVEGGTYLVLTDTPGVTKDGRMIFSGGIKEGGKGTGGGLWRAEPDGSVKLIARKGMAIAGLKADDFYGTIMTSTSGFLSEDGTTVFNSFLAAKEQHTDISRWGAWRVNGKGGVEAILYSWMETPLGANQFGKKGTLGQFKSAAVNAKGEISVAVTEIGGIGAGLLAVDGEGKVRVVATRETPSPEAGLKMNSFENVALNNKGRVTFTSWVFGSEVKGSTAIIAEDDAGKLKMIARAGTEAPDSGGRKFEFVDAPQFCATGQVAFSATLDDKGRGVWMTDTTGKLRLIAVAGQKMPFSSGVTRTISDVSICSISGMSQSGGGDGRARALNNNGTLIYFCRFEDKTSAILIGTFWAAK